MRYLLSILLMLLAYTAVSGQEPEEIFFNLYTDSLKPGTYNYINVVGRDGKQYVPLTEKELVFKADTGVFIGNNWFIDDSFKGDSILVTVQLRSNLNRQLSKVIYMKKGESAIRVKTMEEVLRKEL